MIQSQLPILWIIFYLYCWNCLFKNQIFKLIIQEFLVITSSNKEEIYKIISYLNSNKSCGPNSIPTKVLHLLQDQISNHLALFVTDHSLQEFFLLFWRQPKLSPFTKRILNWKCLTTDPFLSYPILIKCLKT